MDVNTMKQLPMDVLHKIYNTYKDNYLKITPISSIDARSLFLKMLNYDSYNPYETSVNESHILQNAEAIHLECSSNLKMLIFAREAFQNEDTDDLETSLIPLNDKDANKEGFGRTPGHKVSCVVYVMSSRDTKDTFYSVPYYLPIMYITFHENMQFEERSKLTYNDILNFVSERFKNNKFDIAFDTIPHDIEDFVFTHMDTLKLSRKHINSNISLWEGLEKSLFHDKNIIPYIQRIADSAYDLNFIHWDMEYVSIDDTKSWNEFNRAHEKIYKNMTIKA